MKKTIGFTLTGVSNVPFSHRIIQCYHQTNEKLDWRKGEKDNTKDERVDLRMLLQERKIAFPSRGETFLPHLASFFADSATMPLPSFIILIVVEHFINCGIIHLLQAAE